MLALIGGTGLYKIDDLDITATHEIDTPFGRPSAPVIEGRFTDTPPLLFLPRHGPQHRHHPSALTSRANIWVLKHCGARRVVSISATGSLREEIRPGDIAMAAQYFDHTRGSRAASFFGGGVVAHISTARPACPALSTDIQSAGRR